MVEKIITAPEVILPQTGLWGFVLGHWLPIVIVVMLVGFVIDQMLFIVRYRPQDKWKAIWNRLCGRTVEEDDGEEDDPLQDTGYTVRESRTGDPSRYATPGSAAEESVYRAPTRLSAPPPPLPMQSAPPVQPVPPKKEMPGHLPHKVMEKPENLQTDRLHRPIRDDAPVIVRGQYNADKYANNAEDLSSEDDAPIVVRAVKMPDEEPTTLRP